MRHLTIKVSKGKGEEVRDRALKHNGKNISVLEAHDGDLITVYLNNKEVSKFIKSIDFIEDAEINLVPRGIITLYPPAGQAPDQVTDVTYRSPIEIFLGGLQSVGSKTGLFLYSTAGAILVWIGLYTDSSFLLVAAMLVAPFAGPAMNAALAASAGKVRLLKTSLLRYFLAIGTGVFVTFMLSFIVNQQHATSFMVSLSQISQVSILLPLVAGAAGGLNLIQSERSGLVSGASVGMLVAASLAPPTGLVGMALNFGNWQLIRSGIFLLFLQLAVIQFSAALVFRFLGKVTVEGVRFADGKKYIFYLSMAISVAIAGGLLYWQFSSQPGLQKSSLTTQITQVMRSALNEVAYVETIEANARFTRGTLPDKNPVICELYLYKKTDSLSDERVKEIVRELLSEKIKAKNYNADPMFSITILN